MPTSRNDQKKNQSQNKTQSGRNTDDRGQTMSSPGRSGNEGRDQQSSGRKGSSDRVGMNSDNDDSRKGTRATGRDNEDELESGSQPASKAGIQSGSNNTNRR